MRRGWAGIVLFMIFLAGLTGCGRAYQYLYYAEHQCMYMDEPLQYGYCGEYLDDYEGVYTGAIFTVDLLGSGLPAMESFPYCGSVFEMRELPLDSMHELAFNEKSHRSAWHVSPAPRYREHFRADKRGELSEIFPAVDTYNLRAWIFFSNRELAQISVRQYDDRHNDFTILVGAGEVRDTRIFSFPDDFELEMSYVQGVPVRAVMHPSGAGFGAMSRHWFQADFTMGSIIYRVRFTDTKDNGKERMTELVNKIIWGGTERLHMVFGIEAG